MPISPIRGWRGVALIAVRVSNAHALVSALTLVVLICLSALKRCPV